MQALFLRGAGPSVFNRDLLNSRGQHWAARIKWSAAGEAACSNDLLITASQEQIMSDEFHYQRRVEFCETDAAGIAHFSAYFQYMEQAEHAFLRHLGTSVIAEDEAGTISWPRVSANCDYTGPVKFEDVIDIIVRVERIGTKSVTYTFDFRLQEATVATGKLISVCCVITHDNPPEPISIPRWLGEKLRPYVAK